MNTIPNYIKSSNRGQHSESKLQDLENIRLKTLEILESIDKKSLFDKRETIIDPLSYLSYSIRNKILDQVFKEIPKTGSSKHNLQRIIGVAWMDIVYMVALYTNSDIPKKTLLGILHKNMKYGGAQEHTTLYQVIKGQKNNISSKQWENVIEKLESNSQIHASHFKNEVGTDIDGHPKVPKSLSEVPEEIIKEQQKKTVCPFGVIKENHSWIEAVWNFIEIDLIPNLQERVPDNLGFWEDFFAGKLHKKKQL